MAARGGARAAGARIELVDALRAFALIGILQANILSFAWGPTGLTNFIEPPSALDQAVFLLVATFVSTKFIALFAFLFGLGFALQLRGLRRRLADAAAAHRAYRRRLWTLLALGVAHGTLLYYGDILTAYALCGFVLLLYARARPRTLARATAGWFGGYLALSGALMVGTQLAVGAMRSDGIDASLPPEWIASFETYTEGGWLDQLPLRAGDYLSLTLQALATAAPFILGLFLLGALAGRLGWLAHPQRHPRLWRAARRIGWAALPVGALGAWLSLQTLIDSPGLPNAVGFTLTSLSFPLAALYVAWIVAQRESPPVAAAIRWLAPAGRMPLTNYLLQSVAMGALLSGWGLGLGAGLGTAGLSLLALAIAAVQLPLARWWMARVGQGPVEALWRRLTYGPR